MRLIYVLLSSTIGMHQYTADLANRMADGGWPVPAQRQDGAELSDLQSADGAWLTACDAPQAANRRSQMGKTDVVLVTTAALPRDRYSSSVRIETPVSSRGTGFSAEGLNLIRYRKVVEVIGDQASTIDHQPSAISHQPSATSHQPPAISHELSAISHQPSAISHQLSATSHQPSPIVHFTGVHAWNVPLVYALRRRGVSVIHTLHDLHPHAGVRFGKLIRLWNRLIIGSGAHILVHGRRYREELLAAGLPPERVTYTPLLHGFWGYATGGWQIARGGWQTSAPALKRSASADVADDEWQSAVRNPQSATSCEHDVRHPPTVLFFGRVEPYKGVDVLLTAWESVRRETPGARLVIAGPGAGAAMDRATTSGEVEWRDRLIEDDEAIALFRSASLLVLPYRDATQSALVAAAYAFEMPVVVAATGALPEYVVEGKTGWITPPGEPDPLASVLHTALADPGRLQAMGTAGRAWYDEQRGQEEAVLAAMYESTAGRPA